MAHWSRAALAALTLTLGFGCTDPDSVCEEGQIRCEGEVLGICQGSISRVPLEPTLYDWFEQDCAAEGLRCVIDGDYVGCVYDDEPCDPAAFESTCVDGNAVRCEAIEDVSGRSPRTWPHLDDCVVRTMACVVGSTGQAACADPGSMSCDGPDTTTCTAEGPLYCDSYGVGFVSACGDVMGGDVCVETATDAFCVIDDTPCEFEGGPTCSADGGGIIECEALTDDPQSEGRRRLFLCPDEQVCAAGECVDP